jgi:hypothetical protein
MPQEAEAFTLPYQPIILVLNHPTQGEVFITSKDWPIPDGERFTCSGKLQLIYAPWGTAPSFELHPDGSAIVIRPRRS